jgi:hypothetical protein
MTELQEHALLCEYLRYNYPVVIFFSDLSGVKLPIGLAKKIKGLKCSRGIPDLFIAYPSKGYYGLFIELKRTGTKLYKKNGDLFQNEHLATQAKVLEHLRTDGYRAEFCLGYQDAITLIDWYLG